MNHYDNPAFFAAYKQMPRSRQGLESAGEWKLFQKLLPSMQDKNVLDLGCGYGWHCKYAAEHGARKVLGIDQSKMMIDEAKRRNFDEKIVYRVCRLQDYEYPPETFDLIISNLVLHYIEDLESIDKRIYSTLCFGGTFLMNIEHPVFTAGVNQQFSNDGTWPVTDYYDPGWRKTDFLGHTIMKYHHTLTQILMGIIRAGFHIEAVEEAMPPEKWRERMPEEMRRPMMLLVKAVKKE